MSRLSFSMKLYWHLSWGNWNLNIWLACNFRNLHNFSWFSLLDDNSIKRPNYIPHKNFVLFNGLFHFDICNTSLCFSSWAENFSLRFFMFFNQPSLYYMVGIFSREYANNCVCCILNIDGFGSFISRLIVEKAVKS